MNPQSSPNPEESLASYVQRQRTSLRLSQSEVASKARIHPQSVGKIERGYTERLKQKTQQGLAYALEIPEEYLEAVCKGSPVETMGRLKFCPHCWTPGNQPEPGWLDVRAQFCFLCGASLQQNCIECEATITSLKHRFCPFCGTSYRTSSTQSET